MSASKRLFDLVLSAIGIVVLAPVFVAIGALIKVLDGGEVFFWHRRVGRGGIAFNMLKFRTMRTVHPTLQGNLTVGGNARITRIGGWLRRTKLDELPQLLNVFRGEMSFVGPRPEVPHYTKYYTARQRRVLEITPGITDPASMKYWNEAALLAGFPDPEEAYITELMPEKIRINLKYASFATRWTDFRLVLITVLRLLGVIRSDRDFQASLPPRLAVEIYPHKQSA